MHNFDISFHNVKLRSYESWCVKIWEQARSYTSVTFVENLGSGGITVNLPHPKVLQLSNKRGILAWPIRKLASCSALIYIVFDCDPSLQSSLFLLGKQERLWVSSGRGYVWVTLSSSRVMRWFRQTSSCSTPATPTECVTLRPPISMERPTWNRGRWHLGLSSKETRYVLWYLLSRMWVKQSALSICQSVCQHCKYSAFTCLQKKKKKKGEYDAEEMLMINLWWGYVLLSSSTLVPWMTSVGNCTVNNPTTGYMSSMALCEFSQLTDSEVNHDLRFWPNCSSRLAEHMKCIIVLFPGHMNGLGTRPCA